MARKRKAETIPNSAGNAEQLHTKGIEDPNNLKKKHKSPSRLAYEKKRDGLRMSTFNWEKEEDNLRTGMSICEDALRAKGLEVKQEEDKTEKFEFDLEHVKKVTFGEFSYPTGNPRHGITWHYMHYMAITCMTITSIYMAITCM